MHSAESAITKISPWKVQQFAEEEGEGSPFATLSTNLTRLLSTILLTTTACSIYSTALFVTTATEIFPHASLGVITAALTCVTLFFGEILPKALAVNNSELVARMCVPALSKLAFYMSPITAFVTFFSDLVLKLSGLRSSEDKTVSEDMLRMVVDEAVQSSEGIETSEGRMIKAVLDLQDNAVDKIMQPRVDIVAVPEDADANEILGKFLSTKYSRMPVYKESVDNIVGVIFSKDLLFAIELSSQQQQQQPQPSPTRSSKWTSLSAKKMMEPTYFIPETMTTWNALQEMRKRRVHMAIVVDEYGGTSGLVTFEDILEEVVGEIYDEDDDIEDLREDETIFKLDDSTFEMKGYAELDDVYEALGINVGAQNGEEGSSMPPVEVSTIGGLLCTVAGEIPEMGDTVTFFGYKFRVEKVDKRRIISLVATRMAEEEGGEGEGSVGGEAAAGSDGGGGSILSSTSEALGEGKQLFKVVKDEAAASAAAASGDAASGGADSSPVDVLVFVDGAWVKEGVA
jgi:CBS domain containing-hemolysin-like protein